MTCSTSACAWAFPPPSRSPAINFRNRPYATYVLVDAEHVENWWPATSNTPERTETEKALTLFADWTADRYELLD